MGEQWFHDGTAYLRRLDRRFSLLPSWPGLTRLRGRSPFGEAKARPSIVIASGSEAIQNS
jgi:hypothetical protein